MPATYTPGTPQPNEDPSDSQPLFLNNFTSLNQQFGTDHVPLTAGSNNGFHKQVTFTANQGAPGFGTGVSDLFVNLFSGNSELFFQNAATTRQLTNLNVNTAGNGGTAGGTLWWIDTPWGIRFLMASTNLISSGSTKTIIYPNTFSQIYCALATANDGGNSPHYASAYQLNNNTLQLRTDAQVLVSVLVIGKL